MKRLLIVLAVAGLLASFGLTHMMVAAPPEGNKILVCHIDEIEYVPVLDADGNAVIDPATGEPLMDPAVAAAHVISVSASAESAHTGHGDVVVSEDDYQKGDDCTNETGLDAGAKADSED